MIKTYRKTDTIKAEQFDNSREMAEKYHVEYDGASYILPFRIDTPKGWLGIKVGDWIVANDDGEYWPIADDVFKQTYAELPVIPDYIAEYIEHMKSSHRDIGEAIHYWLRTSDIDEYMEDDSEAFVRAWLDGYQVEAQHDTRTD